MCPTSWLLCCLACPLPHSVEAEATTEVGRCAVSLGQDHLVRARYLESGHQSGLCHMPGFARLPRSGHHGLHYPLYMVATRCLSHPLRLLPAPTCCMSSSCCLPEWRQRSD